MKKIRILIIEDDRVLRDGLAAMLNGQADMRVVATIRSGNNVLEKARQTKPQIVLLDVGLEHFDEPSVAESLRKNLPEAKVVGMGFAPTQSDIVQFVAAGASGFILKDASVKEFLGTMRTVAQGAKVLPPSMTDSLFSHVLELAFKKRTGTRTSAVRMTKREREIIVLIADGLSNKEIAQRLNIATHTVKSHVHNVMEKLALHSRLQISNFLHEENS
ncbi:MAG: response regulator transcription factor [Ignavibacteriales bacterium]|nr:response regulator transcription factor [Ignavibacteriales bacterium]